MNSQNMTAALPAGVDSLSLFGSYREQTLDAEKIASRAPIQTGMASDSLSEDYKAITGSQQPL